MNKLKVALFFFYLILLSGSETSAQEYAFYNKNIPVKEYDGKSFCVLALVKAEIEDEDAAARLIAMTKSKSGTPFFNNMWENPIRSRDWKVYSIEGKVDNDADTLLMN